MNSELKNCERQELSNLQRQWRRAVIRREALGVLGGEHGLPGLSGSKRAKSEWWLTASNPWIYPRQHPLVGLALHLHCKSSLIRQFLSAIYLHYCINVGVGVEEQWALYLKVL